MSLTYAELSRRISALFYERGEWAGMPMPLPGQGLVVEDRHPAAAMLADMQAAVDVDAAPAARTCGADDIGWHVVNSWRGVTPRGITGRIVMLRHEDGRRDWVVEPDQMNRNRMVLGPLETFDAWHLDTELTAMERLATLVTERQFRAYVLTGSFIERSTRSKLAYLFRRCRPTVVITDHGGRRAYFGGRTDDTSPHILVCLCLHPIAYYANTFAGAMVPTDDVIAHLMLMRGDEHLFWRRANQHHPLDPESGL